MLRKAILAGTCALALSACATTGGNSGSNLPDPQTLKTGLALAETAWTTYCDLETKAPICRANAAKVAAAEKAANDAVAAYAEAYASGSATQALLDNASALIADALSILNAAKK